MGSLAPSQCTNPLTTSVTGAEPPDLSPCKGACEFPASQEPEHCLERWGVTGASDLGPPWRAWHWGHMLATDFQSSHLSTQRVSCEERLDREQVWNFLWSVRNATFQIPSQLEDWTSYVFLRFRKRSSPSLSVAPMTADSEARDGETHRSLEKILTKYLKIGISLFCIIISLSCPLQLSVSCCSFLSEIT